MHTTYAILHICAKKHEVEREETNYEEGAKKIKEDKE